jgi:hypothetical protein
MNIGLNADDGSNCQADQHTFKEGNMFNNTMWLFSLTFVIFWGNVSLSIGCDADKDCSKGQICNTNHKCQQAQNPKTQSKGLHQPGYEVAPCTCHIGVEGPWGGREKNMCASHSAKLEACVTKIICPVRDAFGIIQNGINAHIICN